MRSPKIKSEFDLIEKIQTWLGSKSKRDKGVKIGIGDDCAVLSIEGKKEVFLSTDMLVEGIDFQLPWTTLFLLGQKSISVNVSDIVAMGGVPRFVVIGLAIPRTFSENLVRDFYSGVKVASNTYKVEVVGGDISSSKKGLVISVSIVGVPNKFGVWTRSGARLGDRILVSGTVGDSAMGLFLLKWAVEKHPSAALPTTPAASTYHRSTTPRGFAGALHLGIFEQPHKKKINTRLLPRNFQKELISRHLNPVAQLKLAQAISSQSGITAAIDISDGLVQDLKHITKASGVGAIVHINRLPLSRAFLEAAKALAFGKRAIDVALSGGEDFGLLLTVRPNRVEKIVDAAKRAGMLLSDIGEIKHKGFGLKILTPGNELYKLRSEGYDHFRV